MRWCSCGFGNVSGHFRKHHFAELEAHGCCDKTAKAVHDATPTNVVEELLNMFARIGLPYCVINDKGWRREVRARKIFVDVETPRGALSVLMDEVGAPKSKDKKKKKHKREREDGPAHPSVVGAMRVHLFHRPYFSSFQVGSL